VVTAEQMSQEILRLIGGTKALIYSILVVTLVVGVVGILNTILMATFERQRELGFMRCVGAWPQHLLLMILLETPAYAPPGRWSG
jgi:putative ABC transport system permease protein